MKSIEKAYKIAEEQYAELGVDVNKAIDALKKIPISLHCWQGDDVGGFEVLQSQLSGGIQVTGNYPGRATTPEELRADLDMALANIPGTHRLNLHAIYAETNGKFVERNEIETCHFQNWIDWAKKRKMGIDFNPTFFSHPMASTNLTLSNQDKKVRDFWIEHGARCRKIAADIGKELKTPCVCNVWIPDGSKDIPADRLSPRMRLQDSLDKIFAEKYNPKYMLDAVESKLFGIGTESYVVGSHEFYMGYAVKNKKLLCLDSGHFHPTETIGDKLSSVLLYLDEVLLHVSRGIRWDSDHVTILNDDLRFIAEEIVRNDFTSKVHIGLDYFDASINRIAAWIIGCRNMQKALLAALLEPSRKLKDYEKSYNYTGRMALMEEQKSMPLSAVWDYFCMKNNVPVGIDWLSNVEKYESDVLKKRASATSTSPLKKLEEVSNFYGSNPDYVLGGGGNTSYKDEKFLYIKPSGISLAKIKDTDFIKMDRRKIRKIFELGKVSDAKQREALSLKTIADAIAPDFSGRPSVETPLHELLPYTYVVHMHPAAVNGMTCGRKGNEIANVLFPDALWIDYVDPGMTLACCIKEKLAEYEAVHYRSPQIIFLKNHGVFVTADSTDEIKAIYSRIMDTLSKYYAKHRITVKAPTALKNMDVYSKKIKTVLPNDSANIAVLPYFKTADGPLTPDHIVYCKSFTLKTDEISAKVFADFKKKYGYLPKVIELKGKAVFCFGDTPKDAALVSALAMDAYKILRFAEAFGSSEYLTEKQRLFIENWEAETYRKKQTA